MLKKIFTAAVLFFVASYGFSGGDDYGNLFEELDKQQAAYNKKPAVLSPNDNYTEDAAVVKKPFGRLSRTTDKESKVNSCVPGRYCPYSGEKKNEDLRSKFSSDFDSNASSDFGSNAPHAGFGEDFSLNKPQSLNSSDFQSSSEDKAETDASSSSDKPSNSWFDSQNYDYVHSDKVLQNDPVYNRVAVSNVDANFPSSPSEVFKDEERYRNHSLSKFSEPLKDEQLYLDPQSLPSASTWSMIDGDEVNAAGVSTWSMIDGDEVNAAGVSTWSMIDGDEVNAAGVSTWSMGDDNGSGDWIQKSLKKLSMYSRYFKGGRHFGVSLKPTDQFTLRAGYMSGTKDPRDGLTPSTIPNASSINGVFDEAELEYKYLYVGGDLEIISVCKGICLSGYVGVKIGSFDQDIKFSDSQRAYDDSVKDELKEVQTLVGVGVYLKKPDAPFTLGIHVSTLPQFTSVAKTFIGLDNVTTGLNGDAAFDSYVSDLTKKEGIFDKFHFEVSISTSF